MIEDAADFAEQHPDQLGANRHRHLDQLFDGQAEGVFLVHRRHIVEPIEIGDVLEVGARLHQLFGAAVQQADMRIDALDDLAVQFQHQAQHAVRGRVLRAEIERELAVVLFLGARGIGQFGDRMQVGNRMQVVSHVAQPPFFSSPGST